MDEKTRLEALDKAKSMINHVGYPDELLDDKKLNKFYEKLEIREDDYLMANINFSIFDMDVYVDNYRKPVNKSDWVNHGYSAVVNAFYNRYENSLSEFLFCNFDEFKHCYRTKVSIIFI